MYCINGELTQSSIRYMYLFCANHGYKRDVFLVALIFEHSSNDINGLKPIFPHDSNAPKSMFPYCTCKYYSSALKSMFPYRYV